jgi:hypothetical protein
MAFAAEMPGRGAIGGGKIPFDNGKFLISALDHKPMDGAVSDDPANLALEFLQTRHAISTKRWPGRNQYSGKPPGTGFPL